MKLFKHTKGSIRDEFSKGMAMMTAEQVNEFIKRSDGIEGWFFPLDMLLFYVIASCQRQFRIPGDICEVGVFKGKSLAMLSLLAEEGDTLFAYDLFPGEMLGECQQNLTTFGNSAIPVRYVKGETAALTMADLKEQIRRPLRILHIDAGHEYHEVLHALLLFAPFVASDGVIIMDDYQDREFPGIEAATLEFCSISSPRRFIPMIAGANKMYLAASGCFDLYQRFTLDMPFFQNECRLTHVKDHRILVVRSKLPQSTESLMQTISAAPIPFEYDVNLDYLSRLAKKFSQINYGWIKQKK